MAEYVKQHYVPKFLLKQWESHPDNKLTVHYYNRGQFQVGRKTAQRVGFERHLYSVDTYGGGKDTSIEKDFMGPYVDTPASDAHKLLLADDGLARLDAAQRGYWAQFLVSLLVRVPRRMEATRKRSIEILNQMIDGDPEFTREWVDKYYPEAYSELAIGVLPKLIQSDFLLKEITNGQWSIRTLRPACPYTLLIGDHPLIYLGSLKAEPLIALPLSPHKAFLFYRNIASGEAIRKMSDSTFSKRLNIDTVNGAMRYVFATDDRHEAFVRKHLAFANV